MEPLARIDALVRSGRFLDALTALREPASDRRNPATVDVQKVAILERLGHYGESRQIAERLLRVKGLCDADRSACECTIGLIDWDEGNTNSAIEHVQRSVLLAKRANDIERLCWSQLRLWTMFGNRCDFSSAAPILSELRANSIRLGDKLVLAALHVFVAEIEAKRGLTRSAAGHSRMASELLLSEPNCWLEAWAENINVAIALMSSDVTAGLSHGRRSVTLAQESGVAVTLRACLANYGNVLCLGGNFDEAVEYFERAMCIAPSSGDNANGVIDAIASVRVAQGRLDEAEQLLDRIEQSISTPDDRRLYVFRHAALTRIKCLMMRGRWQEALEKVNQVLSIAESTSDHRLLAIASLLRAELLLRNGQTADSMQIIEELFIQQPDFPPDLYGRYEELLGLALTLTRSNERANAHIQRARRIFLSLSNEPALHDLERYYVAADTQETKDPKYQPIAPAQTALQGAASLFALGRNPEFLARELIRLATDAGCVRHAVAKRSSQSSPEVAEVVLAEEGSRGGGLTRTLRIEGVDRRTIDVELTVEPDIDCTATINAISILLSAALDLNRARVEREEHIRLWPFDDLLVESSGAVVIGQMQKVMALAQRIARTNISVLITGESGTGKEILARAIHGYSARADKPFVPFNCTAVPREMLESQLFGHRRGAFTGADRDHPGLIRSARDGTLFLDEIGELSLDLQPKLLRFLESGEICPLGEPSPFTVDVRIVAATNSNVEQLVHDGRFREDLFYRLNVIRLTIPPLRERRDEIPALVHHFVARAAAEFAKGRVRVSEDTMEHLLLYSWPGNVRQLQNELRRMTALAEVNAVLTPAAISADIRRATATPAAAPTPRAGTQLAVPLTEKLVPTLSRIEGEMIKVALRNHQGRVDAAAKALGISRKGLYLKRQRLGL